MIERINRFLIPLLAVILAAFTLIEVNFAKSRPLAQVAIFALLGITLALIFQPAHPRLKSSAIARVFDWLLAIAFSAACVYLAIHAEALGQRSGMNTRLDIVVGSIGLLIVLEATRRSVGWSLPLLSLLFIGYAMAGPSMPGWLFPHRGYDIERIVAQTFLRSEGVFGIALRVMFTYVYLFVVFGAVLEACGATQYIVDFSGRLFGRGPGGPAKVAVLSSGLMGTLSGSAVANAATTGAFTIPMMRGSGFSPVVAAGITAAASSGGALAPPVMGAGAYMMLEIVQPSVTYLEIIRAAMIPAILFYMSILLVVHFYAKRIHAAGMASSDLAPGADRPAVAIPKARIACLEGLIFFGSLAALIIILIAGKTPQRAVTVAILLAILLSLPSRRCRITPRKLLDAAVRSARAGVALIAASACVGIVIGLVTLTGVGTAFPNSILPLAEKSLFFALLAIMLCSIVLGMGLPSAVCYLLLALLIGPVLGRLGVVPLAAHFFIFYFGMMSMVTPPVALAGYTAATIANAPIMKTCFAAFGFSLVGFTLPFMFVYRPQLLLLAPPGEELAVMAVASAIFGAVVGITALAGALAGYLFAPLSLLERLALFAAAIMALFPDRQLVFGPVHFAVFDTLGLIILCGVAFWNRRKRGVPVESGAPARQMAE